MVDKQREPQHTTDTLTWQLTAKNMILVVIIHTPGEHRNKFE
jgi:hypothetical protein